MLSGFSHHSCCSLNSFLLLHILPSARIRGHDTPTDLSPPVRMEELLHISHLNMKFAFMPQYCGVWFVYSCVVCLPLGWFLSTEQCLLVLSHFAFVYCSQSLVVFCLFYLNHSQFNISVSQLVNIILHSDPALHSVCTTCTFYKHASNFIIWAPNQKYKHCNP